MKKNTQINFIVSIFILLGISFNLHGQTAISSECGTVMTPEAKAYYDQLRPEIQRYEDEYYNLANNRSSTAVTSIPIKAHIIRNTDGTGGLTVQDLNDALANVNAFYADAFVNFFICDGINYIDDITYYDFETNEESALTSANNVSGLINIYFADSVTSSTSGGGLCGYAYYPGGPEVILMDNSCTTNGSTFPHEIGHFFSLPHTHGPINGTLTDELVDGSNCATTGDQICDTAADPQLSFSNVTSGCVYFGTTTDANGDTFVPNPRNIMSYSRKQCRDEFSVGQLARMYATSKAARSNFSCASFNVNINADNVGSCSATMSVNFTDASVGATSWQWDVDGDDVIDYTTQNPSHNYTSGTYDVTLTISNGSNSISKVYSEFIVVGSQQSLPVDENFDSFTTSSSNGWKAIDIAGNGYNWFSNSGTTPSGGGGNTGPAVDNSGSASGVYIYTEATGSSTGDVAEYISPCISVDSADAELSFAYHMYGINTSQMGDLHVDIDSGSGFVNDVTAVISGNQQSSQADAYLTRTIDLSAYANQTIKVRFRAVRGSGFTSDIAIDDIQISGMALSTNDFDIDAVTIYPNPVNHTLNIDSNDARVFNFEILNLLGQRISSGSALNNQIEMSGLVSGAYFLVLRDENSKIIKRFIKK